MKSQFITAKELAPLLEMKPPKLMLVEANLGLVKCRDQNYGKPVRWFRDKVRRTLRKAGYIVEI